MIRTITILLLFCGSSFADLPKYSLIKEQAKSENKHVLAVVTQPACPPCVKAKKLLEDNEQLARENDCLIAEVDIKSVVLGRQWTPQLVLYSPDGDVLATTEQVSKAGIESLFKEVPLPLLDPMYLDLPPPMESAESVPFGVRRITYAIATQYKTGQYQSSFLWGEVDYQLSFLERYLNVDFQRVNKNPQLWIMQANYQLGPGVFAWARGNTIYISPIAPFGRDPRRCGVVMLHEFGHIAGGSSHNKEAAAIMSANAGTAGNFLPSDYRWYSRYGWKSSPKPHDEPEYMRQYFTRGMSTEVFSLDCTNLPGKVFTAPRYKVIFLTPDEEACKFAP